ncbi:MULTISPECIES: hypothetical protein [Corynebacterium]|uniref:hypothetical protein n=1 Tax=Corynebacterium TaxID=1716 RepID=UPI0011C355E4|nr:MULTISPECIES: hypothetical protein [Corynebacterium]WJZ13604.1 hypothetical protein CGOTT_08440 [Corynebacterium gottingense]WJZ15922.1 hypothetical protein CGOTTB_08405 [Corynebacterium gottingense]
MHTHINYSRPFPSEWLGALARLCREISQLMKLVGDVDPDLDAAVKARINAYFEDSDFNVAMTPEELTRSITELCGGSLHFLNRTLDNDFVSPVIVAPLSRSVVENCSLLLFINSFGDIERTFWAMRAVTLDIKEDKQRDLVPEVDEALTTAVAVHINRHRGQDFKVPGFGKLVANTLGDVAETNLYKLLSSYTHRNAWTAYKHFIFNQHAPARLELLSARFVISALRSAVLATESVASFRPNDDVKEYLDYLNNLIPYLNTVEQSLNTWMKTNGIQPAL